MGASKQKKIKAALKAVKRYKFNVTGRLDGSCVLSKYTFLGDTDIRDKIYVIT